MFGGVRDDRLLAVTPGDTLRFSPSLRVEERFLSGEIELEAWMTNTSSTAKAQDYNSVRSNKRRTSVGGEPTGDDDDSDEHPRRSIERLQSLTGASDDEIRSMYEYLGGEAVLSEQAIVTLPDARVPRDGPTLEELLTPERIIQFATGRVETDGHVYAWGGSPTSMAAADDEDASCEQNASGGDLSTENQVYCWGANSTTAISGPVHTYGSLEVVHSPAGVGIINTPPVATDETSKIGVTADGRQTTVDHLDEWGREHGPASSTSTIVCQVLVQPNGCPCPFPALLHVQRHRNNDQYIYSCGWVIDSSCLYQDSTTVLTATQGRGGGAGKAVFVDFSLATGSEVTGDTIKRLLPDDVSPTGSQLFDGTLRDSEQVGALPDDLAEQIAHTVSSRGDVYCVCKPFDGSYLHLVDDGNTSDTVTFKAGAELSKSVN
ncbi:hypothetical protein GCM10025298_07160 [Natronobiforma cellulositropha]